MENVENITYEIYIDSKMFSEIVVGVDDLLTLKNEKNEYEKKYPNSEIVFLEKKYKEKINEKNW